MRPPERNPPASPHRRLAAIGGEGIPGNPSLRWVRLHQLHEEVVPVRDLGFGGAEIVVHHTQGSDDPGTEGGFLECFTHSRTCGIFPGFNGAGRNLYPGQGVFVGEY